MLLSILEDAITLGVAELVLYLGGVFVLGFAACAFSLLLLSGGK
jgi:hypothetical protein